MRFVPVLILLMLAVPAALLAAPGGEPEQRAAERPAATEPRTAPPPRASLPPVATPAPLPPVKQPKGKPRPPSRAVGQPWAGRLVHGRRLPVRGPGYVTWDPILKRVDNRPWRRWGTQRLLRTIRGVLATYARRHPDAPPVLVGDLSRPRGGDFGPRFGSVGHMSHQNGLDADVYYPRLDGRLRAPRRPGQVDRAAAQELVTLFVQAGATHVFVGPSLGLRGPRRIVSPLTYHDDHLHVRLPG